jgi:protein-tyrosine phosphatase
MLTPAPQTGTDVLFVCTANLCRSPVAEHLLRARLQALGRPDLTVTSRGLWAETGSPMDPAMAALLAAEGVPSHSFTARRLSAEEIAGAGLVLTATTLHRSSVVQLCPPSLSKVFTLLEFSHILRVRTSGAGSTAGVSAVADCAAEAAELRAAGATLDLTDPDIPDPYRRSRRVYQRVYSLISTAIAPLADRLATAGPAQPSST